MKGSGHGGQHQQQQQPTLGEEGDFAVHASVYSKVQAEPNVNSNDQERGKRRERCLSLGLAGLSSYLCRLCLILCVSVCLGLGGWYPPHHSRVMDAIVRLWSLLSMRSSSRACLQFYGFWSLSTVLDTSNPLLQWPFRSSIDKYNLPRNLLTIKSPEFSARLPRRAVKLLR